MKYSYQVGYNTNSGRKIKYIHVGADSMEDALAMFSEFVPLNSVTTFKITRHRIITKDENEKSI